MERRATAAALAMGLLVLVAGCGVSEGTSTPPSSSTAALPGPSPTPVANEYVAAVMRTRGLGTAKASIIAESRIGPQEHSRSATGGLDLNGGFGDLTWTDSNGSVVRELSNGKGLFVQSEVPDGTWVKEPGVESSPTGRVTDVLRGLGTLSGLRPAGTEDYQGLTFQRYTGEVPVSDVALQQVGIDAAEARAIIAEVPDAGIIVTVWIDPSGRVVRVDRTVNIPQTSRGPVSASTITRLTEFSGDLDLSPPPSGSVSAAASS